MQFNNSQVFWSEVKRHEERRKQKGYKKKKKTKEEQNITKENLRNQVQQEKTQVQTNTIT